MDLLGVTRDLEARQPEPGHARDHAGVLRRHGVHAIGAREPDASAAGANEVPRGDQPIQDVAARSELAAPGNPAPDPAAVPYSRTAAAPAGAPGPRSSAIARASASSTSTTSTSTEAAARSSV